MLARLKRLVAPLLILGVALAVTMTLVKTKPKAEPVVVEEKAWLVSAQAQTPAAWQPFLPLYGRVESLWSSTLTSALAADVAQVLVIEGDRVAKGDPLVRLDDRDVRLLLAQREAELREAEARIAAEQTRVEADRASLPREQRLLTLARDEVDRLSDLLKRQVGSQTSLDTARQAAERQAITLRERRRAIDEHPARLAELEARLAKATALRDQAQLDLERSVIRAPFNARITEVAVAPGRRARVGDALLSLYDIDAMVLRSQIPTRHLPLVRGARGQGHQLIATGDLDGIRLRGELLQLAGDVGSSTGGVEALFALAAAPVAAADPTPSAAATAPAQAVAAGDPGALIELLQPGRFLLVDLQLPAVPGVLALPHEAIYGTDQIYVVDADSRMQGLRVERIGETRLADGTVKVLVQAPPALDARRIVTTQLPNASDGLLVRVAAPTATAAADTASTPASPAARG